jgi:hypothetical protein
MQEMLTLAENHQVSEQGPRPLLLGRHFIAIGVTPGPTMGRLLKHAYDAQLDGEFETVESGLPWLKARGLLQESRGMAMDVDARPQRRPSDSWLNTVRYARPMNQQLAFHATVRRRRNGPGDSECPACEHDALELRKCMRGVRLVREEHKGKAQWSTGTVAR